MGMRPNSTAFLEKCSHFRGRYDITISDLTGGTEKYVAHAMST